MPLRFYLKVIFFIIINIFYILSQQVKILE